MKWLRTITGVVENVVSMFRQVDTLIQRIQSRQYIAKVKYENGIYKVTVTDREGNAVDGALIFVYIVETGKQTYLDVDGSLDFSVGSDYNAISHHLVSVNWKAATVRISKNGFQLRIVNNPKASLRVCVLGVEQKV